MTEADPAASVLNSRIEKGIAAQVQETPVDKRICDRRSLFFVLIVDLPTQCDQRAHPGWLEPPAPGHRLQDVPFGISKKWDVCRLRFPTTSVFIASRFALGGLFRDCLFLQHPE
jgi:hypothetical protein